MEKEELIKFLVDNLKIEIKNSKYNIRASLWLRGNEVLPEVQIDYYDIDITPMIDDRIELLS